MSRLELVPLTNGLGYYGLDVPVGTHLLDVVLLTVPLEQKAITLPGQPPTPSAMTVPAIMAIMEKEDTRVTIPIYVVTAGADLPEDAGALVGSVPFGPNVVAVFLGQKAYAGPLPQ